MIQGKSWKLHKLKNKHNVTIIKLFQHKPYTVHCKTYFNKASHRIHTIFLPVSTEVKTLVNKLDYPKKKLFSCVWVTIFTYWGNDGHYGVWGTYRRSILRRNIGQTAEGNVYWSTQTRMQRTEELMEYEKAKLYNVLFCENSKKKNHY